MEWSRLSSNGSKRPNWHGEYRVCGASKTIFCFGRKRRVSNQPSEPFTSQPHRRPNRIDRYRVFSPKTGRVLAPGESDAQKNFAYFVYDGVPEWRAAINPKGEANQRQ